MTILQAVAAGLENTEKRKEPKKKSDRYFWLLCVVCT